MNILDFFFTRRSLVVVAALLGSCSLPMGVDTRSLVEAGLSTVEVRETTFSQKGVPTQRLVSNEETRVHVDIINPKGVALTYSVDWTMDEEVFSSLPQIVAVGRTFVEFTFTLTEDAERTDLVFQLDISAPETGKDYPTVRAAIRCDSPPDPVENLTAGLGSNNIAQVAFTLPSDDDVSSVKLGWRNVANPGSPGPWASTELTVDDAALVTPGSPDLLSSVESDRKRYFHPTTLDVGQAYEFSVTTVDEGGQESETLSVSTSSVVYELSYRSNGGSGTLPDDGTYTFGTSATVDPSHRGELLTPPTGKYWTGWNTAQDGSGTAYAPGDNLTMNSGNVVLWAQWLAFGSVSIVFSPGDYHSLWLSASSTTVNEGASVVVTPHFDAGTASNWQWYIDGELLATTSTLTITPDVGFHTLVVVVTVSGVTYSGSVSIVVNDGTGL